MEATNQSQPEKDNQSVRDKSVINTFKKQNSVHNPNPKESTADHKQLSKDKEEEETEVRLNTTLQRNR